MKRLSYEEISNLCLSLSTLIHAGIGAGDGLSLLAEDEETSEYKELLLQLADKADCGFSLSAAFRESGAFPGYVCGLLETGERSGEVEECLGSLAKYYEERMHMERQIKSALLYPAVLLFIMLALTFGGILWDCKTNGISAFHRVQLCKGGVCEFSSNGKKKIKAISWQNIKFVTVVNDYMTKQKWICFSKNRLSSLQNNNPLRHNGKCKFYVLYPYSERAYEVALEEIQKHKNADGVSDK
jgi:hypothetical protein